MAVLLLAIRATRSARRARDESLHDRDFARRELERRTIELAALQDLSLVLAESLQTDVIAGKAVEYARRFLDAGGAALVLVTDPEGPRVASAQGSLTSLAGQVLENPESPILRSIGLEQPDIRSGQLDLHGIPARSLAIVPLRAHGVTMGALAVVDRAEGFGSRELQLLAMMATHTAVFLANSRFFDMIRRAKEEWVTAFDALSEGLAVVDSEGRIVRTNAALARILDTPIPSLIGQPFDRTAVATSDAARLALGAARRGERPAPVLTRSEPLRRVLRLTVAPLANPEPRPAGGAAFPVVALIEDATDRSRLEARLIQNEKLAAVGQMASGVAHELNNPLTSIAGLAEFLLSHSGVADPEREHLKVIHQQAERAGRIVRNLLTFARPARREESRVDANELVSRTFMLMSHPLRMLDVEVEHRSSPDPVVVRADAHEIQQVLLNLITNAAQAVESLPSPSPRRIRLTTIREAERVRILVEDSGPGVPEAHVPQLFTPFFTTKEPGRGTGLGLSISYGIVQSYEGDLRYFASDLGGAGFEVSLKGET